MRRYGPRERRPLPTLPSLTICRSTPPSQPDLLFEKEEEILPVLTHIRLQGQDKTLQSPEEDSRSPMQGETASGRLMITGRG